MTAQRRTGQGTPLVLLHGFLDTWRTWELVLPGLARHHDVLALTLPGHAGGPPAPPELTPEAFAGALESMLDEAGVERAHLVGNSLGGHLALRLAARGRALSVVAFAPAGGWEPGDPLLCEVLERQAAMSGGSGRLLAHLDALLATDDGRRRLTAHLVEDPSHIPDALITHLVTGAAACRDAHAMLAEAVHADWDVDAERIDCPVRIAWGTADRMLAWPSASTRLRRALPHAEWVEMPGVGHCPQLDAPVETAELILGVTAGR